MVIHHPERYGLAQLHQLRGRVGRGGAQSWCLLLCDRHLGQEAFARIRYFADHLDGFDLAEQDLRLRGPGEVWGVRQHGAPGFKLANPLRDGELTGICHQDAREFLDRDPRLQGPDGQRVRQELGRAWGSLAPFLAG
jgi:ATP-dependent DNA helicase RecG